MTVALIDSTRNGTETTRRAYEDHLPSVAYEFLCGTPLARGPVPIHVLRVSPADPRATLTCAKCDRHIEMLLEPHYSEGLGK